MMMTSRALLNLVMLCVVVALALLVYLQPGNHILPPVDEGDDAVDQEVLAEKMLLLIDRVMQDQWFDARVLPQLHVMLWGNKRGV